MSAPRLDERSPIPRTLAQLWTRGAPEGPLELNTRASATCACGAKPREQRSTTPSGREVVAYIPVDHDCSVPRVRP